MLIASSWPGVHKADAKRAAEFEEVRTVVSEIRFIIASTKAARLRLYHAGDEFITEHAELIKKLSGVSEIAQVRDGRGLNLTQTDHHAWLDLDHDTVQRFVKGLADKLEQTKKSIAQLEGRLNNKAYLTKAPKELVKETKSQLAEAQELLAKQQAEYDRFK